MIKAVSSLVRETVRVAMYLMMAPTSVEIRRIVAEELAKAAVIIMPSAPDEPTDVPESPPLSADEQQRWAKANPPFPRRGDTR